MFYIVIPCYNEEKRLDKGIFVNFMDRYVNEILLFVNDGSTDKTLSIIEHLQESFPKRIMILSLKKNSGKAAAVRYGILKLINNSPEDSTIGFYDSDHSTPIEEMVIMNKILIEKNIALVAGSRIKKMGSKILRNPLRHIFGRLAATLIGYIIKLGFYDTQCGAKVMTKSAATIAFKDEFISNWLFDVEIILRLKKKFGNKISDQIFEYPLTQWIFKEGSKIKPLEPFKLLWHLYRIHKKYKIILK